MRTQMSSLPYYRMVGNGHSVLCRGEARLLNLPYHSLKGAAEYSQGRIGT